MFKILILLSFTITVSAKELDARSWAHYKMNMELLELEKQKLKIIEKYQSIFNFFDERDKNIKNWNQKQNK
jgi:hypothetical protein